MKKKIIQAWQQTVIFFYNQTFFPQDTLHGHLFRYGSAVILTCLLIPLTFLFPNLPLLPVLLLTALFAITLGTLLGNLQSGILLTVFSLLFLLIRAYYERFPIVLTASTMVELLALGSLLSFTIPYLKKISLIKEFNKREREYEKQIILLTQQKRKAEEDSKMREEFISIASHELKTPLTTTLLKLQTALHNVRNVTLANFSVQNLLGMLESAEQQAQRLSKIINNLLNVSLMRTGRLELEFEECDLREITGEVIERFSEKAEKENSPLSFNATEEPINGVFDRVRIEQVVTNLISNAMKYGGGKPIEIKLTKNSRTAQITVKDYGIGITREQINRIFNLFERGVQGNTYKGLGIGLYITSQIIKAHHGRVMVTSKENHGSEFTVELPLKPAGSKA